MYATHMKLSLCFTVGDVTPICVLSTLLSCWLSK